MKRQFTLLLLSGLMATALPLCGDTLKPFTTDGCSVFPDGTYDAQSLWVECCIRHDLAYWKGGTRQQREAADQALQRCVAKVGEPEIAKLMSAGARIGGSPFFPTSFRWGYGWSYQRGYAPLTRHEKEQIQVQLQRLKLILQGLEEALEAPTP